MNNKSQESSKTLVDKEKRLEKATQAPMKFPLMKKAETEGVFKLEEGFLIAAPTATGKSQIGRDIIKASFARKEPDTVLVYLVPYKALAEEVHQRLKSDIPQARLAIATSDYNRPFKLAETDILVATYERAIGVFKADAEAWPSVVVADEASIVGDEERGTQIEALISYFASLQNVRLYCLSAVLRNPKEMADWLKIRPLVGTKRDRPTELTIKVKAVSGRDEEIEQMLPRLLNGGNVLIFCSRKHGGGAEVCARRMGRLVSDTMSREERDRAAKFAAQIKKEYPYLVDLPELLAQGVAFHHADLEVSLRKDIVEAFHGRTIRVIAATPTLAAGINVPARSVILRDITRFQAGRQRLIPVSEAINMLGRAGRPGFDTEGTGYVLVPRNRVSDPETQRFVQNVKELVPETLASQIPQTVTNILFFILSTVVRSKGATRDEIIDAYNKTLWAYLGEKLNPPMVAGEDLLSYVEKKLERQDGVQINFASVVVNQDSIIAEGGGGDYSIVLRGERVSCECPAFKYGGGRPCKHIRELQYHAIRGRIEKEHPRARAIGLASLKQSVLMGHPMYLLATGVEMLLRQKFLEEDQGLLYITEDGRRALISHWLTFAHIMILRDRIASAKRPKTENEVIQWAMEDYVGGKMPELEADEQNGWEGFPEEVAKHFSGYLNGKSYREIYDQRQIPKFLQAREKMEQILATYNAMCPTEKKDLAKCIRDGHRRVHYGCPKELLPLMVLGLDEVADARSAKTLMSSGISDVHKVATMTADKLQRILALSQHETEHMIEVATQISKLISDYRREHVDPLKDREAFATLSTRTGIQSDDLLDYLL